MPVSYIELKPSNLGRRSNAQTIKDIVSKQYCSMRFKNPVDEQNRDKKARSKSRGTDSSKKSRDIIAPAHIERVCVRKKSDRRPTSSKNSEKAQCEGPSLVMAARSGDLLKLNELIIKPYADILRRDSQYGQTVLHIAICAGHFKIVQALLMPEFANSLINIPDKKRNSPLHLAVSRSRRISRMLLKANADVEFRNAGDLTPLGVHIIAIKEDDPRLTEMLLVHKADPNAPVFKSTVLHVALDKKLLQIASTLIRYGARLTDTDEQSCMALDKVQKHVLKELISAIAYPPVWVPDGSRNECMECYKAFKFYGKYRRHHCRYCGRLLCTSCAHTRIDVKLFPFGMRHHPKGFDRRKCVKEMPLKALPGEWKNKQRVCEVCCTIASGPKTSLGKDRSAESDLRRQL